MKITFLSAAADMSGGSRIIAGHARRLTEKGHQITIVARKRTTPGILKNLQNKLFDSPSKNALVAKPRGSHYDGLGLDLKFSAHSKSIDASDVPDADVVVATWWETAEWAMSYPRAKGARAYFIQGHEVFDYLPVDRVRATYRAPFHKIVVSNWLRNEIADAYDDANVDVACNALDRGLFDAPERGRQNLPTIGFTYSRTPWKRIDLILLAVEKLMQEFPGLRVRSFGEKPFSDNERLPLPIDHTINPQQSEIARIYASCDAWVTATNNEGFGLPAMEAMACRTPVVAARSGWPADVLQDGVNGYLADIDDVTGLVVGLGHVLRSSDVAWRDLASQAHATAHRHTQAHSSDQLEAALARAVQRDLR